LNIPKDVNYIIEELNKNDFEAYIVGGAVRDSIMETNIYDYDITTSATPTEICSIFEKTIETGVKFGTITVVINSINYEVTTFRIDGDYIDNRKPETVEFSKNLIEDLSRRDFTINAMAYHPYKKFVDPFNGKTDIQKKIIRCVGEADNRFNEDALRMLRCIRFSTKLGFDIEEITYKAIVQNIHLMKNISRERIRDEFVKIILSDFLEKAEYINSTEIFKYIDELIFDYLQKNLKQKIAHIKLLPKCHITRIAFLFSEHENYFFAKTIARFFQFSNDEINQIWNLSKALKMELKADKYELKKMILKIGDSFEKLLEIKKCISFSKDIEDLYFEILINGEPIYLHQLCIRGEDVKQCGFSEGPEIGNILKKLHEIVLKNPEFNQKHILFKEIEKLKEIY